MDESAEQYRRFLDGDNEALVTIMRDHKDGLIFFFNSFLKDMCLAEELAEETFVKLVIKRPRFSGKSRFKTWLYASGRRQRGCFDVFLLQLALYVFYHNI